MTGKMASRPIALLRGLPSRLLTAVERPVHRGFATKRKRCTMAHTRTVRGRYAAAGPLLLDLGRNSKERTPFRCSCRQAWELLSIGLSHKQGRTERVMIKSSMSFFRLTVWMLSLGTVGTLGSSCGGSASEGEEIAITPMPSPGTDPKGGGSVPGGEEIAITGQVHGWNGAAPQSIVSHLIQTYTPAGTGTIDTQGRFQISLFGGYKDDDLFDVNTGCVQTGLSKTQGLKFSSVDDRIDKLYLLAYAPGGTQNNYVNYYYAYANMDGTVKGSTDCSVPGFSDIRKYDLQLKKGWNLVIQSAMFSQNSSDSSNVSSTSGSIPEDVEWTVLQ